MTKFNMDSTASAARMNAVPLNESVPLLKKILEEMRMNKTAAQQFFGNNLKKDWLKFKVKVAIFRQYLKMKDKVKQDSQ